MILQEVLMALDLSVIEPLLAPILQQVVDTVVFPAIQAEIAKIADPDVQALASAALPSVKSFIDAKIAKLGK